jgi:hypothetical protein
MTEIWLPTKRTIFRSDSRVIDADLPLCQVGAGHDLRPVPR